MKIEISYSNKKIDFDIPEKNIAGIIRPAKEQPALTAKQIDDAINAGQSCRRFIETVQGKRLCVLVPDGTRDLPINTVLQAAGKILKEPAFLKFLICTGTHNAKTERNESLKSEIESLMQKFGITEFDIITHDCEKAEFMQAPSTSRQTPVHYNAAIKDCDAFLALSDVKHHYFAGYSNPVKNLVPGICAYETTEKNHSLSLDDRSRFGAHPWHPNEQLRDNPLAADQVEAAENIIGNRPFWAIVMISTSFGIHWLNFDKAKDAAIKAFVQADLWNVFDVEPVGRMIVSCGGTPNDIDLYIAQRALELTKQAILDGGEILFVSACDKGIGSERTMEHFWNLLVRPMDEIFPTVQGGSYKLFSHKPLRFAELISRLRRLWLYSEIPDDMIKKAHMCPADNVQSIVDRWLRENKDEKILVVDGANKLAIRRKS
jgi:nickel-dependent lactate racemase